jgi:hypothetical protein
MENQLAIRLAKEVDPLGERIIGRRYFCHRSFEANSDLGVLTKPDALTRGASGLRKKWQAVIEGRIERHKLKYGYYCVRFPDDDERARRITREESLEKEAKFFDNTLPWNGMPDRTRFGISNLISDISRHLVRLIESK